MGMLNSTNNRSCMKNIEQDRFVERKEIFGRTLFEL